MTLVDLAKEEVHTILTTVSRKLIDSTLHTVNEAKIETKHLDAVEKYETAFQELEEAEAQLAKARKILRALSDFAENKHFEKK